MIAGQRLGPYVLEQELGRGGMGVVWRARDTALDRTVAIKVLLRALATPAELERFRREAMAQGRLRHPAIVGVHASGETPAGQPYLVLDFVDGENLGARLRAGPLPIAEAVRLTATLARAVSYAHSRGVLHRDLKASNVLVDPQGEPALVDFGLAAIAGSQRLTATGQMMGTPGCMAPEQVTGQQGRIGPRTDVYGLGVLLHEALTGRPPFDAGEFLRLLDDIVDAPAFPPSRHRAGIDARLDAIVLRCLEKDPERRWPTALALAQALEELGRPPPSPRWPGAALVGALLGAAGWAALGPARPAREPDAAGAAVVATTTAPAPTARLLLADAERAGRSGDLQAALRALDQAAALTSSHEALAARALVCVRLGDQAGARRDLLALASDPDPRALAAAAKGLILVDEGEALEVAERAVAAAGRRDAGALAARALARSGRGDRAGALEDARAAAELAPDDPMALLAQGWLAPDGDPLPLLERARRAAEERGDDLARAAASTALARAHAPELAKADVGRLTLALGDLDEALRLAPALRRALRLRALLRLSLATRAAPPDRALLEGAVADAARARDLSGHEPGTVELLAYARSRLAFDPARGLDRAEAQRAVADLTLGLTRAPASLALLVARGELSASLGDFVGAEADARAALAADGAAVDDRATALLARLRGRRGALTDGLAVLEPLLARAGDAPHALAERSLLRAALRDAGPARADAERALARDPTLARAHFALGRALVLGETPADLARARAALAEAARLQPGFAQAMADLALVRAKLGEASPRDTLEELRRAERLEPWAAEHLVSQALYLEHLGDGRQCAEALERALAVEPLFPSARLQRGRRRVVADPEAALVDLLLVVDRQPWSAEAHLYLALAREALGDRAGALRDASRAVELDPRPPARLRALLLRATLHTARQDWAAVLEDAERAVALDPAGARAELAQLLPALPDGAPRARLQAILDGADGPR